MRTHILPKGAHIAPMPKRAFGTEGAKLQGGLPPVAYRNANAKWCSALPYARDPFNAPSVRSECFHATSEWDKTARGGAGKWVAA